MTYDDNTKLYATKTFENDQNFILLGVTTIDLDQFEKKTLYILEESQAYI